MLSKFLQSMLQSDLEEQTVSEDSLTYYNWPYVLDKCAHVDVAS